MQSRFERRDRRTFNEGCIRIAFVYNGQSSVLWTNKAVPFVVEAAWKFAHGFFGVGRGQYELIMGHQSSSVVEIVSIIEVLNRNVFLQWVLVTGLNANVQVRHIVGAPLITNWYRWVYAEWGEVLGADTRIFFRREVLLPNRDKLGKL